MVTTELASMPASRLASDASARAADHGRTLLAGAGVLALTTAGIVLGAVDPTLAGTTRPHPALSGSLADALAVLQNNTRVLAAPYLLWLFGFPRSRLGRSAGDTLMLAVSAASAIPVGIELGRWQAQLLPYIPQLPLEWAALATTVSAWLLIRTNTAQCRHIAVLAVATAVLLIAAAVLETWCTPHRQPTTRGGQTDAGIAREPISTVGAGGCCRRGFCAGAGHTASRSHAPFPSQGSVPLGRPAGADRATSTTTDPHKEGIT